MAIQSAILKLMRILLLNPPYAVPIIREGRCQSPQSMRKTSIPQMTLAYLAGVLGRSGHDILVIDCIADDVDAEALFTRLKSFGPGLALVNTTTPSIGFDLTFLESLKKRFPDCFVTAFGTHVTALHQEIMQGSLGLDGILRGEPEWSAVDLACAFSSGGPPETEIPGCTLRLGGQVVVGPDRPMSPDLDSLGYPDWNQLDRSKYQHPVLGRPYLTINTSRGCTHNCIFCVGHIFYGKKVRFRTIKHVVDEIEHSILGKYKTDLIWIYADDFTASPEYVKDFCREILARKLKITWWTNTRVDKPDREMFELMYKAGCYMLSIGGESGNAEVLKTIKKGTKPEFIRNTVKLLRSVGIPSLVYFLIGLPGDSRETIQETVDFAKSINPDYVEFYPATPYPGTPFYEIAKERKLIANPNWDRYMCGGDQFVVRIPGIEERELDAILRAAYRQFYFRPEYMFLLAQRLLRNPKEFVRLAVFGVGYMTRFFRKA